MKFLTLAIFSLICLGWQTALVSSVCFPPYVHKCLQEMIVCSNVEACYQDATHCWNDNSCIESVTSCQIPLRIMDQCTRRGNCTDKFAFRDSVEQKCKIKGIFVSGGTSVHTGFVATTLLLASYYFLG